MMRKLKPLTVKIDDLLTVNAYSTDDENAHIELASEDLSELDALEFGKLIRICPAGLYREDDSGRRSFDYVGCLECGSCRIVCESTILKKWENPRPMTGVQYRYG